MAGGGGAAGAAALRVHGHGHSLVSETVSGASARSSGRRHHGPRCPVSAALVGTVPAFPPGGEPGRGLRWEATGHSVPRPLAGSGREAGPTGFLPFWSASSLVLFSTKQTLRQGAAPRGPHTGPPEQREVTASQAWRQKPGSSCGGLSQPPARVCGRRPLPVSHVVFPLRLSMPRPPIS